MHSLLFLALAVALSGCTIKVEAPSPRGGNVGNGGDFLPGLFEQGRLHAARVWDRITPEYLPRYLEAKLTKAESDWLFDPKNKSRIAKDLAEVKHVWVKQFPAALCSYHPERTCGCTKDAVGGEVYFSETHCHASTPLHEVGQLILHETLHHFFGADEAKVYRIASVLYGAWLLSRSNQYPRVLLEPFNQPEHFVDLGIVQTISEWTGKELLVWKPGGWWHPTLYNPVTDQWRVGPHGKNRSSRPFVSCPKRARAEGYNHSPMALHSARAGKFLVLLPATNIDPSCGEDDGRYGVRVDLDSFDWDPIPALASHPVEAYASRSALLISAGNRAVFFPFDDTSTRAKTGGLYDPATNRWEPIAEYPQRRGTEIYRSMAWSAQRLVLWGRASFPNPGNGVEIREDVGLVYDPATQIWNTASTINAPKQMFVEPVSVSTGNQIFFYGGTGNGYHLSDALDFHPTGGLFDPRRNTWTPINLEGAPLPDISLSGHWLCFVATWDGHRVVVKGKDLRFYYPAENRWEISNQDVRTLGFLPKLFFSTGLESILWDPRKLQGLIFVP
jgi:hypothetical protein